MCHHLVIADEVLVESSNCSTLLQRLALSDGILSRRLARATHTHSSISKEIKEGREAKKSSKRTDAKASDA